MDEPEFPCPEGTQIKRTAAEISCNLDSDYRGILSPKHLEEEKEYQEREDKPPGEH